MQAYSSFAEVYDIFMDNVPYEEWALFIKNMLHSHGIRDGIICEIGCGTGKMCELVEGYGYDMIGFDISTDMLEIAQEKHNPTGKILYLNQDMREMELYGTVRAFISTCDCINYVLTYEELVETFKLVNNYLDPSGIFIFDINTRYKYEKVLMNNTFSENRLDCSFIWENFYDEDTEINEYDLTLFVEEENGLYRKYDEIHYQRAYVVETIKKALEEAGLQFVAVYEAYTIEPVKDTSEKVTIIAKEITKQN